MAFAGKELLTVISFLHNELHKVLIAIGVADRFTLHWRERIEVWRGLFAKLKTNKGAIKMGLDLKTVLADIEKAGPIIAQIQKVVTDGKALTSSDPALQQLIADIKLLDDMVTKGVS